MRVVGFDRGVHDRAPAFDRRPAGRDRERSDHAHEAVGSIGGTVLGTGECVGDARHRVVVGLERELFLRAEVVVDAALFEARRLGEVAHRSADVALAVEDGRGHLHDPLAGALALGCRLDHHDVYQAFCCFSKKNRPVGLYCGA
jgi:hypothetical protein